MSEVAGRVLDLLEHVVKSESPSGVIELAARTGLDKSTASRMLAFLAERRLVVRSAQTQRFEVGPALLALASTALRRSPVLSVAMPFLSTLRDASGETVGLHLRVGLERVCVHGLESPNEIRSAVTPGERRPLYLGASGRVMLAFLSDEDRARVLRAAPPDLRSQATLDRELRAARKDACLCAVSARIAGLAALSVPLFGVDGLVGAITVSGPVERWSTTRMKAFADTAREAAGRVSLALGGRFPGPAAAQRGAARRIAAAIAVD